MNAISTLVTEICAAEVVDDLPRRERASLDLRTRFGLSIVEPKAQTSYSPYREVAP